MLAALVLLSALACSIGHGRMLAAWQPVPVSEICGDTALTSAALPAPAKAAHHVLHDAHGLIMQLAQFDCAFAGKLGNALITFAAVGWLLRVLSSRLALRERLNLPPGRHISPGRVAQAP